MGYEEKQAGALTRNCSDKPYLAVSNLLIGEAVGGGWGKKGVFLMKNPTVATIFTDSRKVKSKGTTKWGKKSQLLRKPLIFLECGSGFFSHMCASSHQVQEKHLFKEE